MTVVEALQALVAFIMLPLGYLQGRNKRKTAEAERDAEWYRFETAQAQERAAKSTPTVREARLEGILTGLGLAVLAALVAFALWLILRTPADARETTPH